VNRRTWINVIGTLSVLIGAFALAGGGVSQQASGSGDEMPAALSAHLDQVAQALPSNGGEGNRGPGGADEAYLQALAYPGTDIPLAQMTTARSAASKAKGRSPSQGASWTSIGPSSALYPFSPLRTLPLYVPNSYVAAGRVTTLALAPTCQPGNCRLWVGEATGGIWRTNDALASQPAWTYLSGSFPINSVGSITFDPSDQTGNTLWVGTGEANACRSGCVHGQGLFKTTDGGNTWSGPLGGSILNGRGTGSIAIDPRNSNVMYVSTVRAISGMSSVCCSGVERIVIPGAAPWGVYKTTDGGQTWSFIHAGGSTTTGCDNPAAVATNTLANCTPIGVRQVVLDPTNPDIVYASSYARGVWRSNDDGATWTQIKASLDSTQTTTLPWIAVTTLNSGHTRMYVSEGNTGVEYSRVFRSDQVESGAANWTDLTSANIGDPRWGTFNFCGAQCWYDNFVYTPKGYPDIVYVGGSYGYGENIANHRGVVLSTNAGHSWTDMTADGTDPVHPNALHPDQHVIVTNPNNPFQFWEGNDGGTMRSSGSFTNVSNWCANRGFTSVTLNRCQQMLSQVPSGLAGINQGITSLQFQSLSVSPFNSSELQGGTQDNGTWENYGGTATWDNTMIGDGGQSGFDIGNPHFRTHTFAGQGGDVNFNDGALADWIWIGDPLFAEPSEFYTPWISDPTVSKTLFTGGLHVWRTQTDGQGSMTMSQFNAVCNEWTGSFTTTCGDWQPIGADLTSNAFGTDKAGGDVVALARATNDSSTLWAATGHGRVFVSKNADANPASSVVFNRIDSLAPNSPNRFVSSIVVDPKNANHAWISYSGFNATSGTVGHVFEVTYNPVAGTATWVNLDNGLGDLPITALARDSKSGTLYAGTDYGALRLDSGASAWTVAATGMPDVPIAGLTLVPGQALYAASYGQGAWKLSLK